MSKLKVVTVVGTRPEIIRLSRVIARLDVASEHVLVHTGQNYDYELNQVFFDELGIRRPNHFLNAAGSGPMETISKILVAVDEVLAIEDPEALLVLGDTNSCLSALSAKRRRIPVFHMEAGNRCFDMRVPEEINRRMVDHIADINLTYSDIAREYLLREGIPPDRIIKTGSPMGEVLAHYRQGIESSKVIDRLALTPRGYFVVSAHREENIESARLLENFLDVLNTLAVSFALPVIVSTHPRTRRRINEVQAKLAPGVQLLKPLGFFDYVKLQTEAKVTLSDSGTISEESSILNFPALNLRESHERPEAMEEGSVMMVGMSRDRVLAAIALLETQERGSARTLNAVADYCKPNVSEKVIRLIYSYTDYINRVVWHKPHAIGKL
ncbi:MAG: non-hydrolyzing UDP-N-acetylglucosamine 2-epimerase [Lautropia sp.]